MKHERISIDIFLYLSIKMSTRLGYLTGQPEGSLLRVGPDALRQIAYKTPYQDLAGLCRSSSQYRKICQNPNFWWEKTKHDFPEITKEEFKALPEYNDRHRYITIYMSALDKEQREAQSNLDRLKWDYETRIQDEEKRIRDIDYIIKRLRDDRRSRMLDEGEIPPVILSWDYDQTAILNQNNIWENDEGIFFHYQRTDDNGDEIETDYDITELYDDLGAVPVVDLITYRGRMPLSEFMDLSKLARGRLTSKYSNVAQVAAPDDIIMHHSGSPAYFVYRNPEGVDEVVPILGQHLPYEVTEMFKRRNMHSLHDLRTLYDEDSLLYSTIGHPHGVYYLAEDEDEYQEMKEGYYHANN